MINEMDAATRTVILAPVFDLPAHLANPEEPCLDRPLLFSTVMSFDCSVQPFPFP